MQDKYQQFFKVLPAQNTKDHEKPSLGNYNSILQTLKNQNYLYIDFNKNLQDNLILLQKTPSPLKNHSQQIDDDEINDNGVHDFQALGNQFIFDMSNLSKHSYKMMRYVSEGKRIMKKRKSVDEIQNSFIKEIQQKGQLNKNKINFGPKYRKISERNKNLHFSHKIQPQKLQEYLQNKNYHKIQRRLQKSEKQLGKYVTNLKQLKERSNDFSRVQEKMNSTELNNKQSKQLGYTSRNRMNLENRQSFSLTKSESQNLQRINKQISSRIKFPQIKKLSKILADSFTDR